MARPYRIKFENACYLATLRGKEGIGLFVEDADSAHFVELLDLIARKQQVLLHAYALAGNTASLVLETPKANVSLFLQGVQTAFARHIRQHYVQSGPIVKGRFQAKVIEKETVLAPTCEWVHTLPVRELASDPSPAKQKAFLSSYTFSSYLFTRGVVEAGITDPTQLLRCYGSPAKKRAEKHQRGCEAMLGDEGNTFEERVGTSPLAIGSEEFVQSLTRKHDALLAGKSVKGFRRYGKNVQGIARMKVVDAAAKGLGIDKADFFVQQHSSIARPVVASLLYQHAAMTQREIAGFLNLGSAAAVSLQIKRLLQLRSQDSEVDKTVRGIEKALTR
ncbi:MAG: hypothetical protein PF795_14675 [Kiritimatiellae bacterium]|jgi:hypothetical protein|nr:hypothetical protein [Kiritimatiellia bacterium]